MLYHAISCYIMLYPCINVFTNVHYNSVRQFNVNYCLNSASFDACSANWGTSFNQDWQQFLLRIQPPSPTPRTRWTNSVFQLPTSSNSPGRHFTILIQQQWCYSSVLFYDGKHSKTRQPLTAAPKESAPLKPAAGLQFGWGTALMREKPIATPTERSHTWHPDIDENETKEKNGKNTSTSLDRFVISDTYHVISVISVFGFLWLLVLALTPGCLRSALNPHTQGDAKRPERNKAAYGVQMPTIYWDVPWPWSGKIKISKKDERVS